MYESDSPPVATGSFVRDFPLPSPVQTRKLRLTVVGEDSADLVSVKMDLLGMTTAERYDLNPFLDKMLMEHGELCFICFRLQLE